MARVTRRFHHSCVDRRRRRLLQALGIGGAAVGMGAAGWPLPGLAGDESPSPGGTLRVALPQASTIDPLRVSSGAGIAIVQQVGEYLVQADESLQLRPMLATDWSSEEGGRTWLFRLREGVRFHDGREMTAEDVVATFRRLVDPDLESVARSQLDFLSADGVHAEDRYRVRFRLDRPVGAFPYYTHIYNAVILPADYDGGFADNPVGTGPFRLTRFRPRESAVFERNPEYWDAPKPHLERLEFGLYDGDQPQVLAMRGGEADLMLFVGHTESRPLLDDEDVRILAAPSPQHRQLAMRSDRPPFEDRRVRRAVALALNRQSMVQALLGGNAERGNDHPVASVYPEADALDLAQREQDLELARQLLAEADLGNGFSVDLHIGRIAELPQYGVLAQQMLREIGIDVNLQVEPLNTYYEHWTEVGFGLTDWVGRPVPEQILSVAFRGDAEWNAAHWRHETFDTLVRKLEAEPDAEARARLCARLSAILNEEVPAAISYFTHALRPIRRNVRGVRADMSNYLDLTDAWLA